MPPEPGAVRRLELRGVNAYLVDDEGSLTLVDAGTPWDTARVRRMLDRAGLAASDVDRVLLTHYDLDHVGTLASLDLRSDVPVYAADPDASYLERTSTPPLSNHKGVLQRLLGRLVTAPPNEIRRVADGEEVGGFTAYRTPGHTPGHVAYHHAGHETALLGDLVRESGGALEASPSVICYDGAENAESVRAFADRVPAFEVACVGHGDPLRSDGYGALRRLADRL
jgi:glyoxylase-like metal-dependent hydrolase (beta-lactamase superfamily II)